MKQRWSRVGSGHACLQVLNCLLGLEYVLACALISPLATGAAADMQVVYFGDHLIGDILVSQLSLGVANVLL